VNLIDVVGCTLDYVRL